MPRSPRFHALAAAGGALLVSSGACGDDWPQFRKDATHTAVSRDPIAFPLTDVWDWSTDGLLEQKQFSHVAIWNERAYFLHQERRTWYLICANAKIGTVLWRQRLQGINLTSWGEVRGIPAVSPSGKVFVYEWRDGKPLPPSLTHGPFADPNTGRVNPEVYRRYAQNLAEAGGLAVSVFDGMTGQQVAVMPAAVSETMPDVPQVDILHGPPRTLVPLSRIKPSRARTERIPIFGVPLLYGEELYATSAFGTLFRWAPGSIPSIIRVAHPPPGPIPEITIPALFQGYPPLAAGTGVFLADDQSFRFAALVGGEEFHRWHQDLNQSIGIAASSDGNIYAGLGGIGAARGLTCFDASSGQVRWTFAPSGLPFEKQAIEKASVEFKKIVIYDRRNKPLRTGDQALEFAEKMKQAGHNYAYEWERVWMPQPKSVVPSGHRTSAGVVVTQGRVYAEVSGSIVALEQSTGRPVWTQSLPFMGQVSSLVATPKHLIACYAIAKRGSRGGHQQLAALRLDNGKVEWEQVVNAPGLMSLADGLVYFTNGDLTVMGPAERTYLIASDTDDPNHYTRPRPPKREEDPNAPAIPVIVEPDPDGKPAEPLVAPHPAVRADASMLRLSFASTDRELVEKVQARTKLLAPKGAPLALQLDWLDAERAAVAGVPGGVWTPVAEARFIKLCAVLAAEAGPVYFDLAPDVNVYLRRYPERADALLQLLQRAARAVREGAGGCQVVASLNAETLLGAYGKGLNSPFGKLPLPDRKTEGERLNRLVNLVDALGLNVQPQAGFRNANVIPQDYLLRVRAQLPAKPLLVTQIKIEADAPGLLARVAQAKYVQRTMQCCYWLNARWVAQPELVGYKEVPAEAGQEEVNLPEPTAGAAPGAASPTEPKSPVEPKPGTPATPAAPESPARVASPAPPAGGGQPANARVIDPIRLAANKWRRVVYWERVERLTAKQPLPDLTGGEEKDPAANGQ